MFAQRQLSWPIRAFLTSDVIERLASCKPVGIDIDRDAGWELGLSGRDPFKLLEDVLERRPIWIRPDERLVENVVDSFGARLAVVSDRGQSLCLPTPDQVQIEHDGQHQDEKQETAQANSPTKLHD